MFNVVLPTINRVTLGRAIDSVLNQTCQDWHLTIVTQDPAIHPHIPKESRVTTIVLPGYRDTKGYDAAAVARNIGIASRNTPWITYIDDDDMWLPNHLELCNDHIEHYPKVDLFRTLGEMVKYKGRKSKRHLKSQGVYRDVMTVGLCHTREIFYQTTGWQPGDGHDHTLRREMVAAGGVEHVIEQVTFQFLRGKRQ